MYACACCFMCNNMSALYRESVVLGFLIRFQFFAGSDTREPGDVLYRTADVFWASGQEGTGCGCPGNICTYMCGSLQWRHNERDGVSNHQPNDCLLNRLFGCKSRKTSKFRVTGLCVGNSPVTGEFPAQRASHAENVSIWWRHQVDTTSQLNMH